MKQLTPKAAQFSASELMSELNNRGIILRADGDTLRFTARPGSVADLLPELRRLKYEILALVASTQRVPSDYQWTEEPGTVSSDDLANFAREIDKAMRDNFAAPPMEMLGIWKLLELKLGRPIAPAKVLEIAGAQSQEVKPC